MDQEQPARFRLGGVDLAIVSDGIFMQDAGVIMGVVPRTLWEPVIGTPDARNLTPLALNCLLLRSQGKTVLVDTGIGPKLNETQRTRHFPGDYGHLLRRLRAMGVQPDDVDVVINTHLHFDHCGWNTANVHGRPLPTFTNATYFIQRGEYEAATHPNERTRGAYLLDNYAPLAEAGQLELVDGERRITPEITLLPTPGHTADHCSVAIASGGETAIYIGDLVQHAAQIERNAWIPAYDVLPLITLETKKALFDRALRERWLIVSVHAPFPGAGRLVESDGRRRFVPESAGPHPPAPSP